MPLRAVERAIATGRIRRGGFAYHLALLQLDHDGNFRRHSPFASSRDFIEVTIDGFARGAPAPHHLVFKAHPLEDGRSDQARAIRACAARHGLAHRVHYVQGGKLAPLLDRALTAVTVNSTAAEQALWRGLPLKAFGAAVYAKPGFVSPQPLAAFFADPAPPDRAAYRDYRRFLLATSQVAGGFYSARGRRQALGRVAEMMLRPGDPYDLPEKDAASGRQQSAGPAPSRIHAGVDLPAPIA